MKIAESTKRKQTGSKKTKSENDGAQNHCWAKQQSENCEFDSCSPALGPERTGSRWARSWKGVKCFQASRTFSNSRGLAKAFSWVSVCLWGQSTLKQLRDESVPAQRSPNSAKTWCVCFGFLSAQFASEQPGLCLRSRAAGAGQVLALDVLKLELGQESFCAVYFIHISPASNKRCSHCDLQQRTVLMEIQHGALLFIEVSGQWESRRVPLMKRTTKTPR